MHFNILAGASTSKYNYSNKWLWKVIRRDTKYPQPCGWEMSWIQWKNTLTLFMDVCFVERKFLCSLMRVHKRWINPSPSTAGTLYLCWCGTLLVPKKTDTHINLLIAPLLSFTAFFWCTFWCEDGISNRSHTHVLLHGPAPAAGSAPCLWCQQSLCARLMWVLLPCDLLQAFQLRLDRSLKCPSDVISALGNSWCFSCDCFPIEPVKGVGKSTTAWLSRGHRLWYLKGTFSSWALRDCAPNRLRRLGTCCSGFRLRWWLSDS